MATGAKRAAKAEANRTRLLAEAAAMFHHKGYEAVVMRDVAKAAGISTGGIFSQFANKAALFEAAMGHPAPDVAAWLKVVTESLEQALDGPLSDSQARGLLGKVAGQARVLRQNLLGHHA